MTDSDPNSLNDLLSSFALGPSWAKASPTKQTGSSNSRKSEGDATDHEPRRFDRQRGGERRGDNRGGDRRNFERGERGGDRRDGGFRGDRRGGDRNGRINDRNSPPRREFVRPEEGVVVSLSADVHAVQLIAKEIHQVARVYPLFDVAKTLLAERGRCRATFEVQGDHAPLWVAKTGDALFLTKEEVAKFLWEPEVCQTLLDEETVEVDPPTGNFQSVAKCGMSGEWLGPPNFHTYQSNLRRLHRERFPTVPFAVFASRVVTERGEEAVQAWLESMKTKTRWRLKGESDEAWVDDRGEAERLLLKAGCDSLFEETRKAEVTAAILAKRLSPTLLASLKEVSIHARNHPAMLIPQVCRAIEAEHLPIFKWKGKLHTGPSRPHALSLDEKLAERPGIMVQWIREHGPAKLEGLWQAVLPEGGTAPSADFAADLFWLLQRGHVLLFTDDTLVTPVIRPQGRQVQESTKAKKKSKSADTENQDSSETSADQVAETAAATDAQESAAVETAIETAECVEACNAQVCAESTDSAETCVTDTTTVEDVLEIAEPSDDSQSTGDAAEIIAENTCETCCAEETSETEVVLSEDNSSVVAETTLEAAEASETNEDKATS